MSSSVALSSPSTPFLKPRNLINGRGGTRINPVTRSFSFNPIRLSSSKKSNDLISSSSNGVSSSFQSCGSRSSSSWSLITSLVSSDRENSKKDFKIKATPVPESAGAGETTEEKSSGLMQTLQLGSLFGLWYLFNIYFNIYNKQTLKVFPYPVTITTFQFLVGTIFVLLMWTTNLYKKPKITSSQLVAILPLAVVHTMGNLFTNMSLGKVAVSFTHTIKAMEPFFSVVLSSMFLGEVPTLWVISSLIPIVGGVGLASMTEASFNWAGFWSAMASNVTFQSRNVLSKKFMLKKESSLDNITLFSIITIMSLFLLAPVALVMEGVKFTPAHLTSVGLNVKEVFMRALFAGLCFHAYQQVSYMILQRVSPVTHSVGNCVKRVVVIVTSVLFFRTPVSPINSLGTGIALAGVFLYSRVKGIKPKPKPKTT